MQWRQKTDDSFTEPFDVEAYLRDDGPDGPVLTVTFPVHNNCEWVPYIAEAFPALRFDYFVFEDKYNPIDRQMMEKESYRHGKLAKKEWIYEESELAEIKKRIPAFNFVIPTPEESEKILAQIRDLISL